MKGSILSCVAAFIFVSATLMVFVPVRANAGDPGLVFQTIETEHFKIHFHQGLEPTARMAASIFEEVHVELTILFGWEVDGPTHVVLVDSTDSANGVAYVQHRPLIKLYITSPNVGSSLQQHDNWLRTLFVHEYTHMISLRIHSGLARVINAIFGDTYLVNAISPRWYSEGVAVLNETHQTTGGRIRSAQFTMTVRTAALEDVLPTLGEVSNSSRVYPRGTGHYIYGAMFMDYLRTRFGIEKIVDVFHEYGSAPIPFGLNRAFKKAMGHDLITIYDEWIDHLKTEAKSVETKLLMQGITQSTRLTHDGESKGRPIFAPDGKKVIMGIGNGMEDPGIFSVPVDGSPRKLLTLSSSGSPVSLDRSGRIFFTRSAPYGNYYRFSDVFALDRPGIDPRRVTVGARSWAAAISPRGDLLAMTANDAGTSRLVLADERGHVLRTLVDSKPNDQVFVPTWSPDGKKIAAVIRRGYKVDLAIIDVESHEINFVTADRALETNPAFDPTGRYLLYASDRTGISNIYALDLAEDRLLQVTNVLTGAFSPAVSPEGKTLAFLKYSSIGYDLHTMPFDPNSMLEAEPVESKRETPRPLPEASKNEAKRYNPLPSLLPSYWRIEGSIDSERSVTLQALTALSDAVGRHRVGAQVNYYIDDSTVSGRGAYSYSGLGPGLHLGVSHTLNPQEGGYTVGGKSKRWIQEVTGGNLNLSISIPGVDRSHSLSIGYSVTHAQPREEPEIEPNPSEDRPDVPRQYFRAGIDLGWSFSDTVSSPLGISPHKGRSLSASIGLYHPALGGTQKLATIRYRWTEYLGMPWLEHHVLAIRFSGGVNVSVPPKQASFSVGGYSEQNIIDVIMNNSQAGQPSLRGYAPGSFQGDQFHSLKLEYRLPVWFTEAAYATLPVFLRRIQAGVFTDNSIITFDTVDRDDWRSSLGAELVWIVVIGYAQQMSVRTGYAYGFMDLGIHEVILVIGGGF
ncbi:MAG: BamA/TamA family outer membrane protein [Proteobacteria bacterium]|nr:BamA/TamA family outer membrane protein [Pseudomonadota bacterium]